MEQQTSTEASKMESGISTSVSATHDQGEQAQSSTVIVNASQQEADDDYTKAADFSTEDSTTL